MNILALDSSTEACSVALLSEQNVVEKFEIIDRGHAEHLLPMINSLLVENGISLDEIDLFAYGAGPGSFTGLRIGAAMMQGLALARDRKLIAVSSLAALAARQHGLVLCVIDARMEQVYHGLYQNNDKAPPELIGEIAVSSLDAISLPEQAEIIICGTGWDRYQDEFALMQTKNRKITGIDTEYPHAANIARLAMFELELGSATDPAEALPQYVRNKVASKMSER